MLQQLDQMVKSGCEEAGWARPHICHRTFGQVDDNVAAESRKAGCCEELDEHSFVEECDIPQYLGFGKYIPTGQLTVFRRERKKRAAPTDNVII